MSYLETGMGPSRGHLVVGFLFLFISKLKINMKKDIKKPVDINKFLEEEKLDELVTEPDNQKERVHKKNEYNFNPVSVIVIIALILIFSAYIFGQNSNKNVSETSSKPLDLPEIKLEKSSQTITDTKISKTNNQTCQDSFGSYSIYSGKNNTNGGLICDCKSGYEWNASNTSCIVLKPSIQTNQAPIIQPKTYSAETIYSEISPRLAYITCNWYNNYGAVLFSKTSNGLLGPMNADGSGYFINTVIGGVTDTKWTGSLLAPSSCTIQFPAGSSLYAGGYSTIVTGTNGAQAKPIISVSNINIDTAQVNINVANNYLLTYAQKNNYCLSRPLIGDSIAIFGWPINSTNKTLLGNITSTYGNYDTTNVSIPDGMQGSTVVSLKNGCILGQINSLGQILDIVQQTYLFGF